MAGKAYLITHPETAMDKQGKVHGHLDPPLTHSGRQKAEHIGRSLRGKGIKHIHASPRKRAQETAHVISKHTGAPVNTNHDLEPWDLGSLSGAKTTAVKPLLDYYSNHPDKPTQGGEPKGAMLDRYKRFMGGVKHGDAIVGHSQHVLAHGYAQHGGDKAKVQMFGGKPGEVRSVNL